MASSWTSTFWLKRSVLPAGKLPPNIQPPKGEISTVPWRNWAWADEAARRSERVKMAVRARITDASRKDGWSVRFLGRLEFLFDELLPALLDLRGVPDGAVDQAAVRAQDERRGDSHRGHLARVLRGSEVDRQRDVVALLERFDFVAVGVHVDCEDDEVAIAVLVVHLLDDRELHPARPAPGRPDVQEDDVALELRELDGAAVGSRQLQVGEDGRGVFGSRRARGCEQCKADDPGAHQRGQTGPPKRIFRDSPPRINPEPGGAASA